MSLSNIKEGEEKQEDGRQKTHNCGGVKNVGREQSSGHPWPGKTKHSQRHGVGYLDTATQQNTISAALMIILSIE